MIEKLVNDIPDSYFKARLEICPWIRPYNRNSLKIYLQQISKRFSVEFIDARKAINAQFIKLRDYDGRLVFTHFESCGTKNSTPEASLLEFLEYCRISGFKSHEIACSFPNKLDVSTIKQISQIRLLSQNWHIRLNAPDLSENEVKLVNIDALNIEEFLEIYHAICKKHPTFSSPPARSIAATH